VSAGSETTADGRTRLLPERSLAGTSEGACRREVGIIGNILLYRDVTHLTTDGVKWFRPLPAAAVLAILRNN